MTEPPRRDRPDPGQPYGNGYPRQPDPAYAEQAPYGNPYQRPAGQNPTERLNPYQQYGYDPYATGQYDQGYGPGFPPGDAQPPSGGPKSPMWLWVLAAAVVLLVVALAIALVLANSSRQQTVVAPAPTGQEPTAPSTSPPRSSTPRTSTAPSTTPSPTVTPLPPIGGFPEPAAMETVDYNVSGEGRVINITYTDTGGVPQTEFNVVLPWSKQVELASPAESAARISIINVGRDVTCSVAIDGVKVEQSTGSGLTYCVGTG